MEVSLMGEAAPQPSLLATRRGKPDVALPCTVAFLGDRHLPNPSRPGRRRGSGRCAQIRIQRALVASSIFLLAAAAIALRATNTRGEAPAPVLEALPNPAVS